MDIPVSHKIFALAGSLLRNPVHLPGWLSHLPCWRRSPIDLELPWFSYASIDFLSRTLRPDQEAFEFGSGGSSIYLARRMARLQSVENDPAWHAIVTARAQTLGLTNMRCDLHPFGDAEAARYAELPYFNAIKSQQWDVIVVDGFCGYTTGPYGALRPHAFGLALDAVRRPGGMIIVDDYWMYPEFAQRAAGAKLTVFESTGPCRYGVTSTACFQF